MFSNEINRQNILAQSGDGVFKINVLIPIVLAERWSDTKVRFCISLYFFDVQISLIFFDILNTGKKL